MIIINTNAIRRRTVFFLLTFLVFAVNLNANTFTGSDPVVTANAQKFISRQNFSGFQENKGQIKDMNGKPVPSVLFRTEAPGVNLYITEKGLTYVFIRSKEDETEERSGKEPGKDENIQFEWSRIDLQLNGASIKRENIITEGKSKDYSRYFLAHCPEGITDVRRYEKLTINDIYPGIDWVFYNSSEKGYKYDFIVHPGADAGLIDMIYSSEDPLKIKNGAIEIKTELGKMREESPFTYIKETDQQIGSQFKIISSERSKDHFTAEIKFQLKNFIPSAQQTLVIDPQLTWGTFFGGATAHEGAQSITCDPSGNITIVGYLASTDFPVFDPATGNYFQGTINGTLDAFIIKFNNAGVLLWSTFYGGSGGEEANYITSDPNGNIFVTGYTSSTDFPTLNPGGGVYFQAANGGTNDTYILKFNNAGVLLWATYYGGNGADFGRCLHIDAAGNILMTGSTESTNFPVLNPGGGAYFQGALGGGLTNAYVLKFTNAGVPVSATYLGGNTGDGGMSVSTDNSNNVFVVGYTRSTNFPLANPGGGAYYQAAPAGARSGFITKFNSTGAIAWSTFYGGSSSDVTSCIVNDAAGNVFISGSGYSSNLTIMNPGGGAYYQAAPAGGNEIFLLKFTNAGVMTWGTYFGGSSDESFYCFDNLLIDHCNNLYLSFETISTNAPVLSFCPSGYNDAVLDGAQDQFIAKFSNTGVQTWGTYVGGDGRDFSEALAMDNAGDLFMAGEWTAVTNSATYPLVNPGGGAYYDNTWAGGIDDSYVMKFQPVANTPTATSTNAGCGCAGSATATLAANSCGGPPYTYAWSNATTVGPTTGLSSTISNLCPGSYSVIVSDGSCSSDTLFYSITGSGGGFTFTVTPTHSICSAANGSAVPVITGGTPAFTYSWSNGQTTSAATGLAAGSYTCTITDANNCTFVQTFSISSTGSVSSSVTSTNVLCNGGNNGTATVSPSGGSSPYTYLWSPTAAATATATGLSAGNYSVTVTDANGCSSTQTVSVSQPAALLANVTNTAATCNMSDGTATATPSGGTSPYTYLWSPTAAATATATGLAAGIYSVTVTDANGCTQVSSTTIINSNGPTATASGSTTIQQGDSTTLNSSGGITYSWTPSTGLNNSAIANPVASPTTTTTYCVYVFDANGCYDSSCVLVIVIPEPVVCGEFYIPNAFSPNDDNENDVFKAYINPVCVKEFSLTVYNRWGEKVFFSDHVVETWNGDYQGKTSNTGVYAYYCRAILTNGKEIDKKGNVSLIR